MLVGRVGACGGVPSEAWICPAALLQEASGRAVVAAASNSAAGRPAPSVHAGMDVFVLACISWILPYCSRTACPMSRELLVVVFFSLPLPFPFPLHLFLFLFLFCFFSLSRFIGSLVVSCAVVMTAGLVSPFECGVPVPVPVPVPVRRESKKAGPVRPPTFFSCSLPAWGRTCSIDSGNIRIFVGLRS